MNIEKLRNKIVIIDDSVKNNLLKELSNKLINTKIITLTELLKGYLFTYDEKTIYYVCQKYNVCIDVAKKNLDSLYFINNDDYNEKIHFLFELKQDLIKNNLLIFNSSFVNYLHNKDIVLYNLEYVPKIYKRIIDLLSINNRITCLNDTILDNNKTIIKCITKDEEISLIATKISELLLNNININNIKIANLKDDYIFSIKRIFKEFNIPINLNVSNKVYGSKVIKEFIKSFNLLSNCYATRRRAKFSKLCGISKSSQ